MMRPSTCLFVLIRMMILAGSLPQINIMSKYLHFYNSLFWSIYSPILLHAYFIASSLYLGHSCCCSKSQQEQKIQVFHFSFFLSLIQFRRASILPKMVVWTEWQDKRRCSSACQRRKSIDFIFSSLFTSSLNSILVAGPCPMRQLLTTKMSSMKWHLEPSSCMMNLEFVLLLAGIQIHSATATKWQPSTPTWDSIVSHSGESIMLKIAREKSSKNLSLYGEAPSPWMQRVMCLLMSLIVAMDPLMSVSS